MMCGFLQRYTKNICDLRKARTLHDSKNALEAKIFIYTAVDATFYLVFIPIGSDLPGRFEGLRAIPWKY